MHILEETEKTQFFILNSGVTIHNFYTNDNLKWVHLIFFMFNNKFENLKLLRQCYCDLKKISIHFRRLILFIINVIYKQFEKFLFCERVINNSWFLNVFFSYNYDAHKLIDNE